MSEEELLEYGKATQDVYEFSPPYVKYDGAVRSCTYLFAFRRKDQMPLTIDELPRLLQYLGYLMQKELEQAKGEE